MKFPLQYGGSQYNGLVTGVHREESYGIPDLITRYKTTVTKDGVKKTISQYSCVLLDVQIAGYFKSPFEPRIAMAVCQVARGWEGPPHPVYLSFAGCHLEKAFN